jgi:hypothetical protein
MPPAQLASLDIERLLGDLHRKKRWLDTVIDGLEKAIQSPEIRLIEAVRTAFDDERTPRVDLAEDEGSLLRDLALRVPRRSPAMETRSASGTLRKLHSQPLLRN